MLVVHWMLQGWRSGMWLWREKGVESDLDLDYFFFPIMFSCDFPSRFWITSRQFLDNFPSRFWITSRRVFG
jgi:hypothetical protein